MAYATKYRITTATKADVISIVDIYEDGYVGDILEYPCIGYKCNTYQEVMMRLNQYMLAN